MSARLRARRVRPAARTTVPNSLARSPLLRSLCAFSLGAAAAATPAAAGLEASSRVSLLLFGLAFAAFAAGVLVLLQSAAVNSIRSLRVTSKRQVDEIARSEIYSAQLRETLEAVSEYRETGDRAPFALADRVLQSASRRLGGAFDRSVCLYLVETTPHWYVVKVAAGPPRLGVEAGKRCPTERDLEDVLIGLGNFSLTTSVRLDRVPHQVVMVSDVSPTPAEKALVDQLALVLGMAEPRNGRVAGRGAERSSARLRAV